MILRRSGGLWPSVLLAAKGIVGPCAALVLALPTSASGQQTITDGDTLKQGGVIYRLGGIDSPEAKQVCPDGWPATKPKSFVLYVDDDGIPLPGQNVGAYYVEAPAPSLSAEEWMARYAPKAAADE